MPGLEWVTALRPINRHTLSNFRFAHGEALCELSIQVLAMLAKAGLITLDRVAADGTKIRADAGRAHSTAMASDPVSFRISVTPASLLFVNSSFLGPGPNEQPIERSQLAQRISRRPRGLSNRKREAQ